MTFPLSDRLVLGEWLIFVKMQGHTHSKSFEAQKCGELGNLERQGFGSRRSRRPRDGGGDGEGAGALHIEGSV